MAMTKLHSTRGFLAWTRSGMRLPLASVEHIVRAVEATLLPNAPAIVLGAVQCGRPRSPGAEFGGGSFGLPEREIRPEDQF